MINFCTLFDTNYLSRGLALYESLQKNCDSFRLYVFTFDDKCAEILGTLNYPHLTIVTSKEFEDEKLKSVKSDRSIAEYCWTSTSSIIFYSIRHFNLDSCTYVDADLYFYKNPVELIDELGDSSVSITPHNFSNEYIQNMKYGKYCVQFMTFKNTNEGLRVLNEWREKCIEWCYAKLEDGKFGDQKYLDNWTNEYKGVYEIVNQGCGIAPWNVLDLKISRVNGKVIAENKNSGTTFDIIFYHFHGLSFYKGNTISFSKDLYQLQPDVLSNIYYPYLIHLEKINQSLREKGVIIDPHGTKSIPVREKPINLKTCLKYLKSKLFLNGPSN